MIYGKVQNLNDKGFGFIEVEGYDKNVFFHASECKGIKFEQLRKGDSVSMREIESGQRGFTAFDISLTE